MSLRGVPHEGWNPLRLPVFQIRSATLAGDRRPGFRHCACCAGEIDVSPVVRGMWAYCSIECALRMEAADRENDQAETAD